MTPLLNMKTSDELFPNFNSFELRSDRHTVQNIGKTNLQQLHRTFRRFHFNKEFDNQPNIIQAANSIQNLFNRTLR